MMLCYGLIDAPTNFTVADDWAPREPMVAGWILMSEQWPATRPDRFGDWIARPTGLWEWVKYPDPPFAVVYHEGKLKNADTMEEIAIETLPGNVAARLDALETPPPPLLPES